MSSVADSTEERDVEADLAAVLRRGGPHLQDAIKRGFTNIAIQRLKQSGKNGEDAKPEILDDTSYSSKNTQVNLRRLELTSRPSFHATRVSLNLPSTTLELHCSLGDIALRGLYSAFNENLYNLIPVMSEGHVQVSVSKVRAEVRAGLTLHEDALALVNPAVLFTHDEALVRLSWPSPQRDGGYEFTTTEQIAKHMEDLPLTAALSEPLLTLLRERLLAHLRLVLLETTGVSDVLGCDAALVHAYRSRVYETAERGARALDAVLLTVRRTLLQGNREQVTVPALHAAFTHKIGSISFVGKLETESGWVRDLSTVDRAGHVSVWPGDARVTLSATLHIRDLKLGFDEYRVKCAGAGVSGRLLVAVPDNSLLLTVTAGAGQWGTGYAQLDALAIQTFDGLDVHMTGLGPLSWLAGAGGAWLAGHVSAHVRPLLERQLATEVARALADVDVWAAAGGL